MGDHHDLSVLFSPRDNTDQQVVDCLVVEVLFGLVQDDGDAVPVDEKVEDE
ncbi:hypothetical protein D3C81_2325230 [compost metagenome]